MRGSRAKAVRKIATALIQKMKEKPKFSLYRQLKKRFKQIRRGF